MGNLSLNLLTFPLWWYTTGWNLIWSWNKRQLAMGLHQTGISVFFSHLNEPLYGDYTRSGRFLGFFFRIILLVFKMFLLLVRLVGVGIIDALFLASLPVILAIIVFQLLPARL